MRKFEIDYDIYRNDQWNDYEIIIEANSEEEAIDILMRQNSLRKFRKIKEIL